MSRIEDALKKAKENRKSLSITSVNYETDKGNTLVSGKAMSVVKKSTSSLIKLMHNEAEVDESQIMKKGIILPDSKKTGVTDSFRSLRTQLLQKSKNSNFVVLVTSCVAGDDSAFVAMNMGAAFSFDESKTALVIDCDFQSSTMDDMMNMEYEVGLQDFLEGDVEVNEILKDIGVRRLRVIPSGNKRYIESEYFTTERMKVLLDGLVERYEDRYVFLNSPAISDSVDASILVDLVDYVIVVAPYGRVTMKDIEASIKKIDKSKLLGVILNDVPVWEKVN